MQRLRFRLRFSAGPAGLMVALIALTAATIGSLVWRDRQATARAPVDAAMSQGGRLTEGHVEQFLRDAEGAARPDPQLVA